MSLIFKKSTAQPQFTDPAAITGTAEVGETLTCTHTVTKARASNVVVRWYSYNRTDGIEPTGETLLGTGATYVLTGNEVNKYVRAVVAASNPAGTALSTSSFTGAIINTETPPEAPTLTSPATISGTAEVGGTMTVAYGFDGETSVAIQWWAYTSAGKTGGVELGTASTQALTIAEDGKYIGCEVTATNAAGNYVSAAALVGPVAPDATVAPVFTTSAIVSLDEGADGFNEGEYIVCNFGVSGATELPTVAWYKCDAGKANPELLTGAGEACIKPLPVSEPNNYRAALFLAQSLGLNAAGKYVYAVATAVNGEAPSGVTSESGIVGPIGAIQGTPISQTTVGDGPYYLPTADTTYYLTEDISTGGTAIVMQHAGQKLNLNGKTITFCDATPAGLVNGGFETGDFTGWDRTNAPSSSIYTVVDQEDDWNLNRYNSGSYSCRFSTDIHVAPYTEEYLEQADITLERYKWYALSCMFALTDKEYSSNWTRASGFLRVYHNGQLYAENVYVKGPAHRGMQHFYVIFQAWHEDPTYTFRVGVQGTGVGTIVPAYIDDVRLTRTHAAGIACIVNNWSGGNRAGELEITNGGTGYVDGTYTGVQSTRLSGGSAHAYPKLDVTVSGGVVTSAAVNYSIFNGGGVAFHTNDVVLTIPNASLGGSGSGLAIAVIGLSPPAANNVGTKILSNRQVPLDVNTSTCSAGSRTKHIKNGSVINGQDVGNACNGLYLGVDHVIGANIAHKIHRVSSSVTGFTSSAISTASASYPIYIADSSLVINHGVTPDRDNNLGACILGFTGTLARCVIDHYGSAGAYQLAPAVTYANHVYGCVFKNKMRFTNQSSLQLTGTGTKVYDNQFVSDGDYYGRCCHLSVNQDVEFYSNIFNMTASRWNREYNGTWRQGEPAVQFEEASTGGAISFHNNTMNISAAGGVLTSGYSLISGGIRWSSVSAAARFEIFNNTINVTASGQAYAAAWMTAAATAATFDIRDNAVNTDSGYWIAADSLINRTLRESVSIQPLAADSRRLLILDQSNTAGVHSYTDFVDLDIDPADMALLLASGTRTTPAFGTGYETGRGGYRIKWTTVVDCGAAGATVEIKNATDTVVASGETDASGLAAFEVQQYFITGSTYLETAPHTVTVTSGELSGSAAFNADAPKTVNVSLA